MATPIERQTWAHEITASTNTLNATQSQVLAAGKEGLIGPDEVTQDLNVLTSQYLSFLGTINQQQSGAIPFAPISFQPTLPDPVPCYCRGTRLATHRGEVPVEELAVGELVVTRSGYLRPVTWIGHRRVLAARHASPEAVYPVRFLAGSFAPNVPKRDLMVSPDHGIFHESVLIPARYLINGVTVIRETGAPWVHYFHVELDSHDIVLAEGVPAESYFDCGNRSFFGNNDGVVTLNAIPDLNLARMTEYARRYSTGAEVIATRACLFARAVALGFELRDEPGVRLVADRTTIWPAEIVGDSYLFALPNGARELSLASYPGVPSETDPTSDERRRLGVAVTNLRFHSISGAVTYIGPDGMGSSDGWYPIEHDLSGRPFRWTDGRARLPALGRGILVSDVLMARTGWKPQNGAPEMRARG